MRDEGFNEFSICFSKAWCAAEVCRVRFDQHGVEVILADKHTQPVSQPWLSFIRTVLAR